MPRPTFSGTTLALLPVVLALPSATPTLAQESDPDVGYEELRREVVAPAVERMERLGDYEYVPDEPALRIMRQTVAEAAAGVYRAYHERRQMPESSKLRWALSLILRAGDAPPALLDSGYVDIGVARAEAVLEAIEGAADAGEPPHVGAARAGARMVLRLRSRHIDPSRGPLDAGSVVGRILARELDDLREVTRISARIGEELGLEKVMAGRMAGAAAVVAGADPAEAGSMAVDVSLDDLGLEPELTSEVYAPGLYGETAPLSPFPSSDLDLKTIRETARNVARKVDGARGLDDPWVDAGLSRALIGELRDTRDLLGLTELAVGNFASRTERLIDGIDYESEVALQQQQHLESVLALQDYLIGVSNALAELVSIAGAVGSLENLAARMGEQGGRLNPLQWGDVLLQIHALGNNADAFAGRLQGLLEEELDVRILPRPEPPPIYDELSYWKSVAGDVRPAIEEVRDLPRDEIVRASRVRKIVRALRTSPKVRVGLGSLVQKVGAWYAKADRAGRAAAVDSLKALRRAEARAVVSAELDLRRIEGRRVAVGEAETAVEEALAAVTALHARVAGPVPASTPGGYMRNVDPDERDDFHGTGPTLRYYNETLGERSQVLAELEDRFAVLPASPTPAPIVATFDAGPDGWMVVQGDSSWRPEHRRVEDNGYVAAMDPDPRPTGSLDLVLVFDVTGSMEEEIDQVRRSATELVRELERRSRGLRLGLIGFRDRSEDGSGHLAVHGLADDVSGRLQEMDGWRAAGGGSDAAEDQLDALAAALDFGWRRVDGRGREVTRAIVVITDAPAKVERGGTDFAGRTIASVASHAREMGIRIYPLVVSGGDEPEAATEHADRLASGSGGKLLAVEDADTLTTVLVRAVEAALERGDPRYWEAPRAFLGDLRRYHGRCLSFRLLGPMRRTEPFWAPDLIVDGEAGSLLFHGRISPSALDVRASGGWEERSVCLNADAGWTLGRSGGRATEKQIADVLANVRRIRIRADFYEGPESIELDEVVLGADGPPTDVALDAEARRFVDRIDTFVGQAHRQRRVLGDFARMRDFLTRAVERRVDEWNTTTLFVLDFEQDLTEPEGGSFADLFFGGAVRGVEEGVARIRRTGSVPPALREALAGDIELWRERYLESRRLVAGLAGAYADKNVAFRRLSVAERQGEGVAEAQAAFRAPDASIERLQEQLVDLARTTLEEMSR